MYVSSMGPRPKPGGARSKVVHILSSMEECASSMGQHVKVAVKKDAQTMLNKEECASSTVQRSTGTPAL